MRIKPRSPAPAPPPGPAPKRSIPSYPRGWLREESFYRDITTRALSVAIVAVAGYVLAVSTGYVATPPGSVIFSVFVFAGIFWVIYILPRFRRRIGIAMLILLAMLAADGLALYVLVQASPHLSAERNRVISENLAWWIILAALGGAALLFHFFRRRK